jgi:hypothetical protein
MGGERDDTLIGSVRRNHIDGRAGDDWFGQIIGGDIVFGRGRFQSDRSAQRIIHRLFRHDETRSDTMTNRVGGLAAGFFEACGRIIALQGLSGQATAYGYTDVGGALGIEHLGGGGGPVIIH